MEPDHQLGALSWESRQYMALEAVVNLCNQAMIEVTEMAGTTGAKQALSFEELFQRVFPTDTDSFLRGDMRLLVAGLASCPALNLDTGWLTSGSMDTDMG